VPRVERGFEYALLQFQIALANLVLLIGQQLFQFFGVLLNRVCLIGEVKGQDVGIRESQDCCADRL
jgi:hypothetical protein